eukprot:NODE_155_length_16773_cov_0.488785.p9 type:complete len:271 gc:universal NODE_155_length_16773_cov_0.488785:6212-5400(-)
MEDGKDIFITQRGGKIQLEPIKAYVNGSYEFPMQPILLNNNIASIQDTYLFDVQEQQLDFQRKLIEAQTNHSKWLVSKEKLKVSFFVEKQKYFEHKDRFSKFIEENRLKMKRSNKKSEDDVKARILVEDRIAELILETEKQKIDLAKVTAECQTKKELEHVLDQTLRMDPQSSCLTVSSWISHVDSLLLQKSNLESAIREVDCSSLSKLEASDLKASKDSSINIGFEEAPLDSILEAKQIGLCMTSISEALKCKPKFLHLIIKDYIDFLK